MVKRLGSLGNRSLGTAWKKQIGRRSERLCSTIAAKTHLEWSGSSKLLCGTRTVTLTCQLTSSFVGVGLWFLNLAWTFLRCAEQLPSFQVFGHPIWSVKRVTVSKDFAVVRQEPSDLRVLMRLSLCPRSLQPMLMRFSNCSRYYGTGDNVSMS